MESCDASIAFWSDVDTSPRRKRAKPFRPDRARPNILRPKTAPPKRALQQRRAKRRSLVDRAAARIVARRGNGSCGGGDFGGRRPFDAVDDGRNAPAIGGSRAQPRIAETGTRGIAHRRELAVGAR